MKKITLSILALTWAGYSFSQSNTSLKAIDQSSFIDAAPYQAKSFISADRNVKPQMSYSQSTKSANSISYVNLGSAGNILTVLNGSCNVVAANDALSTVVFIHRNDPSVFGLTVAQYRYDISKDEGQSFQNNIGPLNPAADNLVGGISSRYPMVAFYVPPASNTEPDSMWGAYFGTWHNGSNTNDTWDGSATGVFKLNGDNTTWTETNAVQNNYNVGVTTSLCNGLNGEFWAVDYDDLGDADSILLVYKGVWNTNTRDVDWTIAHYLSLPLTFDGAATHTIEPVIAFDPSGMNGWIGTAAGVDPSTNFVYEPIFYRTTDGGVNWTGPFYLDLSTFSNVMTNLDPGGIQTATCAFDDDIVVDMHGDPHFAVVVGCKGTSDYTIDVVSKLYLYDFSYSTASLTWSATVVDSVQTFRGDIATAQAPSAPYATDNRPQLSISPTGDKVFFIWSDSDPNLTGGDNTLPELWGKGVDVNTGLWSPTFNFTTGDAVWDPHNIGAFPSIFPSVSPTSLRNSANNASLVPVVVMRVNASLSGEDPATFYYFNNIQFDDALFVNVPEVSKNDNSVTVFPNPASDEITVYFNGTETANASITLTDVLGKTVRDFGNNFSGIGRYNVRGLDAGMYFITIKSDKGVVTQRFEIAK